MAAFALRANTRLELCSDQSPNLELGRYVLDNLVCIVEALKRLRGVLAAVLQEDLQVLGHGSGVFACGDRPHQGGINRISRISQSG